MGLMREVTDPGFPRGGTPILQDGGAGGGGGGDWVLTKISQMARNWKNLDTWGMRPHANERVAEYKSELCDIHNYKSIPIHSFEK